MKTKGHFGKYGCGCFWNNIHGCGVVEFAMHLDLVMQPCRNVFSVQCKRTLLDLVVRNGNLAALVSEKGGRQHDLHEAFHQEDSGETSSSVSECFVDPFD